MARPIRVLLVEDNPRDVDLVGEWLAELREPRTIMAFADRIEEAIALLRLDAWDAILLDLILPDGQGPENVRRLRVHAPTTPIVVLTGTSNIEVALEALRAGAQDYLIKGDLTASHLARAVRYAIERHAIERQLRETEDRLREARKIEAVGRLAGGVAHDINNMMTVVTGFAELLLDRAQDPASPFRRPLEEIHRAGSRSAQVARELLAFSRCRPLEPKVLLLNPLLEHLARMLTPLVAPIELELSLADDIEPVFADPAALEQVLVNLAFNARDAMPSGGRIKLATTRSDSPSPGVALWVRDSGCGMEPEVLARVFEPYFTTKEPGKGNGLGLATAHGIIEQSGGSIRMTSEPGRGTTVRITLPAHRAEGEATGLGNHAALVPSPQTAFDVEAAGTAFGGGASSTSRTFSDSAC